MVIDHGQIILQADMEHDGTWGDHVILYAAANCFDTFIHVISSQSDHRDLTIKPDHHVPSTNPLVLGHVPEVHYVSLKPRQGGDDNEGVSLIFKPVFRNWSSDFEPLV